MAIENGVCAIVPRHQEGYRPKVLGMGILVDDREVLTCAHVVDAAIGEGWFDQPGDGVVRVCFPFSEGPLWVSGTVDRHRYSRADRAEEGKLTDIAVVRLIQPAPTEVGRVVFRSHVDDAPVKVFGFRCKELEPGGWESHPDGEIVESKVLGPLPGGRVYFEGLRPAGAAIERGFSGAGVYDPRQGAVVGMVVKASAEAGKTNAQFIDQASLCQALGRTITPVAPPPGQPRTTTLALVTQVQERMNNIEAYLQRICEILPDPDADDESPFLSYLQPILLADTPGAKAFRAAFGFPPQGDRSAQLYKVVGTGGDRAAPFLGLVAQRMNQVLWRLGFTLECIPHQWAKEGRRREASIRTICDPHLIARQPTLQTIRSVFDFVIDLAAFSESAPDPTIYAVLRAFDHTQPHLPPDTRSEVEQARKAALDFLVGFLDDLLAEARPPIHDSSHVWWAVRKGFCYNDHRFRDLLPRIATRYGDVTAPPVEVARRSAVPEVYKPLRTASYTLSNAQAIVEHDHNLDGGLLAQLHRIIQVMLDRLLIEQPSKQLYLASVHHEGLRNYLDYVKDQGLAVT